MAWFFVGAILDSLPRSPISEPTANMLMFVGAGIFSAVCALTLAIYRCPVCDRYLGRFRPRKELCPNCGAKVRKTAENRGQSLLRKCNEPSGWCTRRLAGVDIGSVESVRARPELKEAPAEVVMLLSPAYELNIPSDSTASLETAGVLGETYVEIDVGHASGPTIGSNAVLRTVSTPQITTQEFVEKVGDILSRKAGKTNPAEDATSHKNASKNSSQPR